MTKKIELKWVTLDKALSIGANCLDASEILGVSEDTIQRNIRSKFNVTFAEYREKKMTECRQKLRQKQYEVALAGNVTMLIWLGKQMLGQTDKVVHVEDEDLEFADGE